jgi:hypothetical protein
MSLWSSPPQERGGMAFVSSLYITTRRDGDLLLGNINPVNLRGLKQALFVLHSLEKGRPAKEIAERLGGDLQLVEIWTNFLIHNHWIENIKVDSVGVRYLITDKGKDLLQRIDGLEVA